MCDLPTHLQSYGFHEVELIRCRQDKRPAYKNWQSEATADRETHKHWFIEQGHQIGITTGERNGIVVMDVDSRPMLWRLQEQYGFLLRSIVLTPRGAHAYFRWPGHKVPNAVKVRKGDLEYDIRGDGGFVMAPPSVVDTEKSKGRYRFMLHHRFRGIERLTRFPDEFMPPEKVIAPPHPLVSQNVNRRILMARAYIAKIFAVSGSGGHDATFRAVCKLRDRGLTRSEAAAEMELWNSRNADPPWSPAQLEHKLASVYGK